MKCNRCNKDTNERYPMGCTCSPNNAHAFASAIAQDCLFEARKRYANNEHAYSYAFGTLEYRLGSIIEKLEENA